MADDFTTYSDIDRWRLAVCISDRGIQAWLADRNRPQNHPEMLIDALGDPDDDDKILHRIENAVYDKPTVLDDFETDIVIETPRVLAAPKIVSDDDLYAAAMLNEIYPCDADDIYVDDLPKGASLVYAPVKGLKSFLMRTFAGSRITSHLTILLRQWLALPGSTKRVCVNIRDLQMDIAAVDEAKRLMLTGCNPWETAADIVYHAVNAAKAAGFDPAECEILFTGPADIKGEVMKAIRPYCAAAVTTPMPTVAADSSLPLPVALCLTQSR